MERFFGMMPKSEIEIEKMFKDSNGGIITIQAGKHGWTITYPNSSSLYLDIDATAEENYNDAYNTLIKEITDLTPYNSDNNEE